MAVWFFLQTLIADNSSCYAVGDERGRQQVVSPWSLYVLLSLLTTGLSGNAKAELSAVLGHRLNDLYLGSELQSLIDTLQSSSFCSATFVLVDKRLSLNAMFVDRARRTYHADIVAFNASAPQAVVDTMNAKTRNLTEGYIDRAVDDDVLTPATRLALLNAMHLRARWYKPFMHQWTLAQPFYREGNGSAQAGNKTVPTMSVKARFPYSEYGSFSLIDLRLRGNRSQGENSQWPNDDYIMTILLPRNNVTLSDLEDKVNWWPILSRRMRNIPQRYMNLYLPRFNISRKMVMNDPLKRMGVHEVFGQISGNNLFVQTPNLHDIGVNNIVQKVTMTVNEDGLTASAATVASLYHRTLNPGLTVRVNRPFLYIVWHLTTQLALFAGAVRDPE